MKIIAMLILTALFAVGIFAASHSVRDADTAGDCAVASTVPAAAAVSSETAVIALPAVFSASVPPVVPATQASRTVPVSATNDFSEDDVECSWIEYLQDGARSSVCGRGKPAVILRN